MLRLLALALALVLCGPASAQQSVVVPATMASVAITVSSSTTTSLVAPITGKAIYVTAVDVIASGTGDIQFVYGTGATCGTGQNALTGNYPLTAQVGFTKGTGVGALWVIPSGNRLCVITDAAITYAGSLAYAQF